MSDLHDDPAKGQWTAERARDWGSRQPWRCGMNFLPSGAVNFLEMWRAATFDPASIDRELGWAAAIGFNALRTNLHYLDWSFDRDGLIDRVDRFLDIASGRGIATMLCLFDDCEFSGEAPQWGPQPHPRPGVHNGRAVGSPGRYLVAKREEWPFLRAYVHDLLSRFADDPRVIVWDLYNEPGNRAIFRDDATGSEHCDSLEPFSHALMRASFAWGREVAPSQPLTVAPWRIGPVGGEAYGHPIDRDALALSDVVSYHAYCSLPHLRFLSEALLGLERPLFCTEWMARTIDSRISEQLPYFGELKIGAFQWGLVKGRTQTYLPWPGLEARSSDADDGGQEWFHDILTEEGAPHSPAELEMIKALLAPPL
ncbi:MAG: 1,4-beta-xylanase [Rhodobacteraceae bacterium]|nr:1,4-beta-xylanase [Paracoccaceae bacterium]